MALEMQKLGFSHFSAPIDHHKSLRPFIPEITARGGGGAILLPLLEKHSQKQKHRQTSMEIDCADVDTSLSLFTPPSPIYDPMPLRCFNQMLPNLAVRKRKRSERGGGENRRRRPSPIYDPMPLRCFNPMLPNLAVRKRKRSKRGGGENRRRRPSVALEFGVNGGGGAFLYRKRLEESDVRGDLNRLFVTRREAVVEFLTAEELAAVDGSRGGVRILGVDEGGKRYDLVLKKWRSLNVTVINSDWNKLVAANGARRGDEVQIWGFRQEDGKPAFAVVFRRG